MHTTLNNIKLYLQKTNIGTQLTKKVMLLFPYQWCQLPWVPYTVCYYSPTSGVSYHGSPTRYVTISLLVVLVTMGPLHGMLLFPYQWCQLPLILYTLCYYSPTSGVIYHWSPTRYVTIPLPVVLVTMGPLHAMLLFPYQWCQLPLVPYTVCYYSPTSGVSYHWSPTRYVTIPLPVVLVTMGPLHGMLLFPYQWCQLPLVPYTLCYYSPTSGVSYHLSSTRYVTIPLLVVLVTIGPLHAMLLFPYQWCQLPLVPYTLCYYSPTSGVSYHLSSTRYVTIPLLVVLVTICPLHGMLLRRLSLLHLVWCYLPPQQ